MLQLWDLELVHQISCHPAVERVVALGTLFAMELRVADKDAGYIYIYPHQLTEIKIENYTIPYQCQLQLFVYIFFPIVIVFLCAGIVLYTQGLFCRCFVMRVSTWGLLVMWSISCVALAHPLKSALNCLLNFTGILKNFTTTIYNGENDGVSARPIVITLSRRNQT